MTDNANSRAACRRHRPDADAGRSRARFPPEELARLTDDIVAALKTVYDPEIPADIYELGLIYRVDIDDDRNVNIDMTLTAPGCPSAAEMPVRVENAVASVPGVRRGQGQHGLGSAVGPEPHVGRGAHRAQYVVNCEAVAGALDNVRVIDGFAVN